MIVVDVRTEGLEGISREFIVAARKVSRSALSKSATVLARRMRQNLSRRGGPSTPGQPPARVEGALRDLVGKDRPRRALRTPPDRDEMSVLVGIGVGKAKKARAAHWKSRGMNVFEYAILHERGGIGADGRRYPPRSFARTAEEASEAEINQIMKGEIE